jgi:tricorn protease
MVKRTTLFLGLFLCLYYGIAQAEDTRFLHWPDISGNRIVFVYGGNLWLTTVEGGTAVQLTSQIGNESRPRFSPDGKWIAFTARIDGNDDIYVMPSAGGTAHRVTYHPEADSVLGWSPDGTKILFASGRAHYALRSNLFTIDKDGGHPMMFPMRKGFEAAFSPDGKSLAYTPTRNAYLTWKRYRGGETPPIWVVNLSDYNHVEIPHENATDTFPVWLGDRIYFLSDRDGVMAIYEYNTQSRQVRRLVENGITDVDHLGGGSGKLVYTSGGYLYLFDIASGSSKLVKVDIESRQHQVGPERVNVSQLIMGADISPDGDKAAFEARGEIMTVGADGGNVLNLTRTPGAREISPAWSPDGKRIAYLSDAGGEYALYVADTENGEVTRKIEFPKPDYYRQPLWSPDGAKIAYLDKMRNIGVVTVATGKHLQIEAYIDYDDAIAWSPDGKWIAYGDRRRTNFRVLKLYSLETNKTYAVTDGIGDAYNPAFSKEGNFLFFLGSTNVGPTRAVMDLSALPFVNEVTWDIYGVLLRTDVPVPLMPGSGEATPAQGKTVQQALPFRIDPDNISARIIRLPVQPARYSGLRSAADGKLLFYEATSPNPLSEKKKLRHFDMKSGTVEDVLSDVGSSFLSADGTKILYSLNRKWGIISAMESHQPGAGMLDLSRLEITLDPQAEWRQIFIEAWRKHRDYFYDRNMHGIDWNAIRQRYESYLPDIRFRTDLNFVLRHMLGEIVNSHTEVLGGDIPGQSELPEELGGPPGLKKISGGLLGADYVVADERYRVKKILRTSIWDRDEEKSPLAQPGVDVKEGDYILTVNGQELKYPTSLYSLFINTAGTRVSLRVSNRPQLEGSRVVTVVPLESERELRRRAWIEENRKKVDELSGGKIAYVYQPNTGPESVQEFVRYFFPQADRAAIIIDERFNDGGADTDYQLDILDRQQVHWYVPRQEPALTSPFYMISGPKVMLVNAEAGSGGDVLPYQFSIRHLGTTVGTRTWGGVQGGSAGAPYQMIDGGIVTTPSLGTFSPEGKYILENSGFTPEHVVENFPRDDYLGRDRQLEKAVELIMEELKKNPPKGVPPMEKVDRSLEAMRKNK